MARQPTSEQDKYVPKFKEEHVSEGGRLFGIKKVSQTSMFEITATGQGDLPKQLKGRFTSTNLAEKTVRTYLDSTRRALEAAKLAVERKDEGEEDILKASEEAAEALKAKEEAEKPSDPAPEAEKPEADKEADSQEPPKPPKSTSKVPVTAKTSAKAE